MSESPLSDRGGTSSASGHERTAPTESSLEGERAGAAAKRVATRPAAGDVVDGKYRLHTLIARGGMATVWLAHNETLDVQVALKFIRPDLTGPQNARLADRLLQEARSTAQLGHPAIVRVHDFGKTESGVPYLVMELLEGESLDVALDRRGRVSGHKAVRVLLPVAHALAAAHDKGIVHRDLKPENIFLAQVAGGRIQPKLIDFGISKVSQAGAKRVTWVGEAVGTPAYMSPQQARGEDADHRADIWAFCVMLYEMVTGRLPFEGSNIATTARAIIEDAPQPIGAFSAGDDALWSILEKGLRKDPAERWKSMREVGSELACWLLDRGIHEDVTGAGLEAAWLLDWPPSSQHDPFASMPPPARPNAAESAPAPPPSEADEPPDDSARRNRMHSGAIRIAPSLRARPSHGPVQSRPAAPTPAGVDDRPDRGADPERSLVTAQTLPSGPAFSGPQDQESIELAAIVVDSASGLAPLEEPGPADARHDVEATEHETRSQAPTTAAASRTALLLAIAAVLLLAIGVALGWALGG